MDTCVSNCNLPVMSQDDRNFLGANITVDEVFKTVVIKRREVTGPDRIFCKLYKTLDDVLPFCSKCLPKH